MKTLHLLFMSLSLFLFSGCSFSPVMESTKHMEEGYIVAKDEQGMRILISERKKEHSKGHPEATWYSIKEDTELVGTPQKKLTFHDLRLGYLVEAWNTGIIDESYPSQATGTKIVVLKDEHGGSEHSISETTAIERALRHYHQQVLWFVKRVSYDATDQRWRVELFGRDVDGKERSHTILVHAENGVTSEATELQDDPQEEPSKQPDQGTGDQPKIVLENEAFRIYEPSPDSEVGNRFVVRGEARVFEAAFQYSFEDGHNILAKGFTMASQGAPEWGSFEITVEFDQATSPVGVLTIFEASAKDGSPQHVLHLPLKIKEEHLRLP